MILYRQVTSYQGYKILPFRASALQTGLYKGLKAGKSNVFSPKELGLRARAVRSLNQQHCHENMKSFCILDSNIHFQNIWHDGYSWIENASRTPSLYHFQNHQTLLFWSRKTQKKMDAIKVVDSRRFEIDRMRIICIFQKKCLNIKSRVQKSKSFVIQFDQKWFDSLKKIFIFNLFLAII